MSSSAHSIELRCAGFLGIYMECWEKGFAPVGAGSWCKKWNNKRRAALTFTDEQNRVLSRGQKEAFGSIKRDIRRECIEPGRTK